MPDQRLEVFTIEVFDGKSMSDLIRESYDAINTEHATTEKYLRDIISKAKNASDVMMIQETLSNLLNNMGKKPENLIKLLATVQRITSTKIIGKSEDDFGTSELSLTDEEKGLVFELARDIVKIEGGNTLNELDPGTNTQEQQQPKLIAHGSDGEESPSAEQSGSDGSPEG